MPKMGFFTGAVNKEALADQAHAAGKEAVTGYASRAIKKHATSKVSGVVAKKLSPLAWYEQMARWVARGLQFLFALVVTAMYARRVDVDRRAGEPQSVEWVFAVTVGGLSCVTSLFYCVPLLVSPPRFYYWDLVLFVLWIATFGTFAGHFLKRESGDEYEGVSVRLMKTAVWLDLINCIFWLVTGLYGCVRIHCNRFCERQISKFTNKAKSKGDQWVDDGFNHVRAKTGTAHKEAGDVEMGGMDKVYDPRNGR